LSTPTETTLRFGPYELLRPLSPGAMSERWLALHERDHSSHVVHRFAPLHDRTGHRRFLAAVEGIAGLAHPHLVGVEQFSICPHGRGVVVTPYTGNQDGLVTLGMLLEIKGGRLGPNESDRAVTHLLEALDYGHRQGVANGPIGLDQVLVDRHGRVLVELFGLSRRLQGLTGAPTAEQVRDEVRAVAQIAYQLVTGLASDEPRISASRLVKRLTPAWEAWLERGLDGVAGFESAGEAIEALPSSQREEPAAPARGSVRTMLSRFRWPSRSRD
jgi:serine/threonine protein kinase